MAAAREGFLGYVDIGVTSRQRRGRSPLPPQGWKELKLGGTKFCHDLDQIKTLALLSKNGRRISAQQVWGEREKVGLLCLAKWKRGRGGEADIRPSVGGRWWDPYMATGQPGKKSSLTDLGIP